MSFSFSDTSRNFRKLRLLKSLCFERIRLNPLSGKTLNNDCVSVIVSWFTFLIEDFVVCCYKVTKPFCSRYCFASASSARSPCHLGSQAYLAILIFREVTKKMYFSDATYVGRSDWEMCAGAGTSVSSRFSVNASNHFKKVSQSVSRCSIVVPLFIFVLGFSLNRASFLVPDRHFALLLDLKMYLTSPAVAM